MFKKEKNRPLELVRFRLWVKELTLFWMPLKANPEKRICMQVVYLGSDYRKQWWQSREVKQRREGSQYKCLSLESYHHGQMELNLTVYNMHLSVNLMHLPPARDLDSLSTKHHKSLAEC